VLGVSAAGSIHTMYEQTLPEDISLITSKLLGRVKPMDRNNYR
jgi:hypothetical protein